MRASQGERRLIKSCVRLRRSLPLLTTFRLLAGCVTKFAGLRSLAATPKIIFYRLKDGRPEIVRVLDGRQDVEEIFPMGSRDNIVRV